MDGNITFSNGYALIIGVGKDLPMTVTDATGIYNILTDPGRAAYGENNVILLTDRNATRSAILQAFDDLAAKTRQNNNATVIIYYSGHGGEPEGSINDYYLLPFDYDETDYAGTGISAETFNEKINALNANKLIIFLDCCFAGGIVKRKNVGDSPYLKNFVEKAPTALFSRLNQGRGRAIISSCRADEYSIAAEPYSIFTESLIEALSGENSDENDEGYANILDVTQHLLRTVPKKSKKNYPPYEETQHPQISQLTADNDFAICYYAGGRRNKIGTPVKPILHSNSKIVHGTVFRQGTGEFVPDALVRIPDDTTLDKKTDSLGDFRIDEVPLNASSLRITKQNFSVVTQINDSHRYEIDLGKTVKGTVIDKKSNKAVSGATVIIPAYDLQTRTNENGIFKIDNVPNDADAIRIEKNGKEDDLTITGSNRYEIEVSDQTIWVWLIKKLFEDEFWQRAIVLFIGLIGFSILISFILYNMETVQTNYFVQFLTAALTGLFSALVLFSLVPPETKYKKPITLVTSTGFMIGFIILFSKIIPPPDTIVGYEGKVLFPNNEPVVGAEILLPNQLSGKIHTNKEGIFKANILRTALENLKFDVIYGERHKLSKTSDDIYTIPEPPVSKIKKSRRYDIPSEKIEVKPGCSKLNRDNFKKTFWYSVSMDNLKIGDDYDQVGIRLRFIGSGKIFTFTKYEPNKDEGEMDNPDENIKEWIVTPQDNPFDIDISVCVGSNEENLDLSNENLEAEYWFQKEIKK